MEGFTCHLLVWNTKVGRWILNLFIQGGICRGVFSRMADLLHV